MATHKGDIGKVSMKSSHVVEWSIENFCSYTVQNDYYTSLRFTMSGLSNWYLLVFPNGQTAEDSIGWISLYIMKINENWVSTNVRFIFGVKKVDGTVEYIDNKQSLVFESNRTGCGCPRFLERSKLQQRLSELLASGTLTLTCSLWTGEHFEPTGSLGTLSRHFAGLFSSKKDCDATVKVMDVEFPVHKMILSARSPVLATLFEADMKEKRTGLVEIEDFDPETSEEFLKFLYSGKLENDSCNVFELYKIADKYDVQDLKSECLISIMTNLSVENVLEAAILGNQFNESKLMLEIQKCFKENFNEIICSTKWDNDFLSENVALANELLKAMAAKN